MGLYIVSCLAACEPGVRPTPDDPQPKLTVNMDMRSPYLATYGAGDMELHLFGDRDTDGSPSAITTLVESRSGEYVSSLAMDGLNYELSGASGDYFSLGIRSDGTLARYEFYVAASNEYFTSGARLYEAPKQVNAEAVRGGGRTITFRCADGQEAQFKRGRVFLRMDWGYGEPEQNRSALLKPRSLSNRLWSDTFTYSLPWSLRDLDGDLCTNTEEIIDLAEQLAVEPIVQYFEAVLGVLCGYSLAIGALPASVLFCSGFAYEKIDLYLDALEAIERVPCEVVSEFEVDQLGLNGTIRYRAIGQGTSYSGSFPVDFEDPAQATVAELRGVTTHDRFQSGHEPHIAADNRLRMSVESFCIQPDDELVIRVDSPDGSTPIVEPFTSPIPSHGVSSVSVDSEQFQDCRNYRVQVYRTGDVFGPPLTYHVGTSYPLLFEARIDFDGGAYHDGIQFGGAGRIDPWAGTVGTPGGLVAQREPVDSSWTRLFIKSGSKIARGPIELECSGGFRTSFTVKGYQDYRFPGCTGQAPKSAEGEISVEIVSDPVSGEHEVAWSFRLVEECTNAEDAEPCERFCDYIQEGELFRVTLPPSALLADVE